MRCPRPRTRRQAPRPRAPRHSDLAAPSPAQQRRPRGPGPCPTLPCPPSTSAPALRPLRAPETLPRSRASPPRRIGESARLPGSECGRRLACGSRWAPPPDCRAPLLPAAAFVLSRPQPSPLYSPPPLSWVRPAALRPNNAQLHWSERPTAVQHYSLLLVNLKQGAGPEKGGALGGGEKDRLRPLAEGRVTVGLAVALAAAACVRDGRLVHLLTATLVLPPRRSDPQTDCKRTRPRCAAGEISRQFGRLSCQSGWSRDCDVCVCSDKAPQTGRARRMRVD